MKITKIAVAILFATMIFASCNAVKDALDVTFDTSFKASLPIVVPPATKAGVDGTFTQSVTIDPLSDADVAQYADNIKSFEITAITGKVVAINKDINLVSMTVSVVAGTRNASWAFANEAITHGTELTLSNDNGQWDTINSILGDKETFTVTATGETDQDDVQFTFEVTISTRVVANPL